MDRVDDLAKVLWDYHHLNNVVEPADVLMCFTSLDLTVAKYCAELFHKKYAPLILISGGNATNKWIPDEENIQRTNWGTDSEAEKYLEVVLEMGVPRDSVILETKSSNSGENVIFLTKYSVKRILFPNQ